MKTSEFIEIGKERNNQTAVSTADLMSLNTKFLFFKRILFRWQEAQNSVYFTTDQVDGPIISSLASISSEFILATIYFTSL